MGKINYENYKGLEFDILTPRQRQVMKMRLSGMKVNDIASELGISQAVVSTLLHNARERLDGKEISTQNIIEKIVRNLNNTKRNTRTR